MVLAAPLAFAQGAKLVNQPLEMTLSERPSLVTIVLDTNADVLVDVVGHRQRTAQRDLVLGEPAEVRVLHVPVDEVDCRIDDALQLHALRREL